MQLVERVKQVWNNRIIKLTIQILFVGFILFFIYQNIYLNWTKLKSYDWQINGWLLTLSFIILLGHRFFGAAGWYLAVRILIPKRKMPRFKQLLKVYSISNLASYIPGTYWSILGRIYLSRELGFSTTLSSASIIIETILVVFSGMIMTLPVLPTLAPGQTWVIILGLCIMIILVIIGVNNRFINFLASIYSRITKKNVPEINSNSPQLLLLLLTYILVWVPLGISLFLLTRAIYSLSSINVFFMIGYFASAWLIGFFVPVAPAGLGVREAVLVFFLHQALVPDPLPTVLAILFRILMALQDLLWALLVKFI